MATATTTGRPDRIDPATVVLIFPHQLFKSHPLLSDERTSVCLVEDTLFFGDRHHPATFHTKKLILHRASMRRYADRLRDAGHSVAYVAFDERKGLGDVIRSLRRGGVSELRMLDPVPLNAVQLIHAVRERSFRFVFLRLRRLHPTDRSPSRVSAILYQGTSIMSSIGTGYFKFFKQLKENNTKEWFHDNKKRYEEEVKKPFNALVEELLNDVQRLDPTIEMEPKKALFRINRDIRFSADKSPYNTVMKAAFAREGRKSGYAGYYLGLGVEGLHAGGGMYDIEKSALSKVRDHIAANRDEFLALAGDKNFVAMFGGIQGERNKRIPADYNEVIDKVPQIANKQFYYMAHVKPAKLPKGDELHELIVGYFAAITPLNNFLNAALS